MHFHSLKKMKLTYLKIRLSKSMGRMRGRNKVCGLILFIPGIIQLELWKVWELNQWVVNFKNIPSKLRKQHRI